MAEETTMKPAPQKIHRAKIGLNVFAQVVLVLILAAFVNSLGLKHYKRWDFSRDQKYALSDKTKRFFESIKGKVRVTVFFGPEVPIALDVQNLLTEYQYAAKGKIDMENIDPSRNLSRAKEMFDKYKVVSDESLIVIDYEGRNKTVKASEMAEVDQSGAAFGEGPRIGAFKGEQAITSAMMDLVEGKKNVLGYVLGHKENRDPHLAFDRFEKAFRLVGECVFLVARKIPALVMLEPERIHKRRQDQDQNDLGENVESDLGAMNFLGRRLRCCFLSHRHSLHLRD